MDIEHNGYPKEKDEWCICQISFAIFSFKDFKDGEERNKLWQSPPSMSQLFFVSKYPMLNEDDDDDDDVLLPLPKCVFLYDAYIRGPTRLSPYAKLHDPEGNMLTVDYLNQNGISIYTFFPTFFNVLEQHLFHYKYEVYGFSIDRDLNAFKTTLV